MGEDEMAGAKLQMDGKTGKFILTRHGILDRLNDAGMLLEHILQQIRLVRVSHFHIKAFVGSLNKTENTVVRIKSFCGKVNAPVSFSIAEARIDFVGLKIAIPHMLDPHSRIARRRVEV